jgi:hypothetical protein
MKLGELVNNKSWTAPTSKCWLRILIAKHRPQYNLDEKTNP